MSQEAVMAIEDGAALATALNIIDDLSKILFAQKALEEERLNRWSQMHEASLTNGFIWHFPMA